MTLLPKNNWVSVRLVEEVKKEKEDNMAILLPEDYKPQENPYKVVTVIKDPEWMYSSGSCVVVPTHIIREIEVCGSKHYLVERNHIMAVVEE